MEALRDWNPPRTEAPVPHLSAGRYLVPQRYVIGWPDGVVKVGNTWHGRRRWGRFVARGGKLIDLAHYEHLGEALEGEQWLQKQLARRYRPAFREKQDSLQHLGASGGGWLECFAVPPEDWPEILALAAS